MDAITYLLFASFFCRTVAFVATIHSDAGFEARGGINKWARKIMFGLNACVPVTISKESEQSFESFYGRKGRMIMNGVSDYVQKNNIHLRDNEKQIVFLHPASCQPVKNQELLFSAFNKLIKQGYDAKLIWVGNNKSFYALFNTLVPLMNDRVLFMGIVENVRDYMVASDAMCLSSKIEGMPMTIIEAFSVGCIPICTPVGGIRNMISDKKNGLLSKDTSVDEYYRTLKVFCDLTEEERETIRKQARTSFNDYSIIRCANNYLLLYEQSLKKR